MSGKRITPEERTWIREEFTKRSRKVKTRQIVYRQLAEATGRHPGTIDRIVRGYVEKSRAGFRRNPVTGKTERVKLEARENDESGVANFDEGN